METASKHDASKRLEKSEAVSPDRKKLQKELGEQLRRVDRETLARLRLEIARAKKKKREARAKAVGLCRSARQVNRARAKAMRAEARARVNLAIEAERLEARQACEATKAAVRSAGCKDIEQAKQVLEAERRLQKEIRRAGKRARDKERVRRSSAEARAESDDEVRQNIPAELAGVFERIRGQIKGTAKKSRTEAFLEWIEAHPGEVYAYEQERADRELAELVKKEAEQSRRVRKAKRYRRPPEELAAELAAVPF